METWGKIKLEMRQYSAKEKVKLIKYLFKGREDVFALYWEKGNKKGYIPAETYRNTISRLSPYYQYGLTATPFRKGNEGKIIFIHLGEIIAEIKEQEIEKFKRARIIIRNTWPPFTNS